MIRQREQIVEDTMTEYQKLHGVTSNWTVIIVKSRLHNEAYKVDLLTGKTFKPDVLSAKRIKNNGQSTQFYIEGHHEPIVSKELFDRVQQRFERRAA